MRTRAILFLALIGLICEFASGQDATPPPPAFVGTFSNGVMVEFVGLASHPSAKSEWWKPDGTPLKERPYEKINARMGPGLGEEAFEACWRWHNLGDADVQTDYSILPTSGGGSNTRGKRQGSPEETLDKIAFIFNTSQQKTCIIRFTISTPATDWVTTLETQAGHSSSTSKFDPGVGSIGASFLPQHRDGADTIVAVAYKIPGREVRLVAVEKNGTEHVANSSGGGLSDFDLREFRFKSLLPEDIVTWRLQTRTRKREIREFHNVSLVPGQKTMVPIVEVQEAPPVVNGVLQFTAVAPQGAPVFVVPGTPMPTPIGPQPATGVYSAVPAPVSAEEVRKASQKRYEHTQSLLKQLTEQHGYKLDEGESLKYVPESENKPRQELQQSIATSMSLGAWMSQPEKVEDKYEPCLLIFEQSPEATLRWVSSHNGITTLSEVLEHVLELKRQQIECPPGLLMTYMPGDWVLSWDPQKPHEWSDAELGAFEKILNEEKDLGVKVAWKTVERPAIILTGEYKASPKSGQLMSPEVADRADGTFEIPARRSDISASVGTYEKLLQAIGEVLMLPVVDEATLRPTKPDFIWSHTGNPNLGQERLTPADEERVLKSLSEQMGYDFKIEPREVKLLSIEQVKP